MNAKINVPAIVTTALLKGGVMRLCPGKGYTLHSHAGWNASVRKVDADTARAVKAMDGIATTGDDTIAA